MAEPIEVPKTKQEAQSKLLVDKLQADNFTYNAMNILNNYTGILSYLLGPDFNLDEYLEKSHGLDANKGLLHSTEDLNNIKAPGIYYWNADRPKNSNNDWGTLLVIGANNQDNPSYSYQIEIPGNSYDKICYRSNIGRQQNYSSWNRLVSHQELVDKTQFMAQEGTDVSFKNISGSDITANTVNSNRLINSGDLNNGGNISANGSLSVNKGLNVSGGLTSNGDITTNSGGKVYAAGDISGWEVSARSGLHSDWDITAGRTVFTQGLQTNWATFNGKATFNARDNEGEVQPISIHTGASIKTDLDIYARSGWVYTGKVVAGNVDGGDTVAANTIQGNVYIHSNRDLQADGDVRANGSVRANGTLFGNGLLVPNGTVNGYLNINGDLNSTYSHMNHGLSDGNFAVNGDLDTNTVHNHAGYYHIAGSDSGFVGYNAGGDYGKVFTRASNGRGLSVTNNLEDSSFGGLVAAYFTQPSDISLKRDINPIVDTVENKVLNTDFVSWNYKNDDFNELPKYGIAIDDVNALGKKTYYTPSDFIMRNQDDEGFDYARALTVLGKFTQKLQKQNGELSARITALELKQKETTK